MPHTPSTISSPTLTSASTTTQALSAFPLAFLLDGGDGAPAVPSHLQRELAESAAGKAGGQAGTVARNAAREAMQFGLKRSGAVRKPKLTRKGKNFYPTPLKQEQEQEQEKEGEGEEESDSVEVEEEKFPLSYDFSRSEPRAGTRTRTRIRTSFEVERGVRMDLEMGSNVLSFTTHPVTPSEDALRMSYITARRNGTVNTEVMCPSSEQPSRAKQKRRWEREKEDVWKGRKESEKREEMREKRRMKEVREEEMFLEARRSCVRFEIGPEEEPEEPEEEEVEDVDVEVVVEEPDQERRDSGYEGEDEEKEEKVGVIPKVKVKKGKCGGVVRVLRLAFCRPTK